MQDPYNHRHRCGVLQPIKQEFEAASTVAVLVATVETEDYRLPQPVLDRLEHLGFTRAYTLPLITRVGALSEHVRTDRGAWITETCLRRQCDVAKEIGALLLAFERPDEPEMARYLDHRVAQLVGWAAEAGQEPALYSMASPLTGEISELNFGMYEPSELRYNDK